MPRRAGGVQAVRAERPELSILAAMTIARPVSGPQPAGPFSFPSCGGTTLLRSGNQSHVNISSTIYQRHAKLISWRPTRKLSTLRSHRASVAAGVRPGPRMATLARAAVYATGGFVTSDDARKARCRPGLPRLHTVIGATSCHAARSGGSPDGRNEPMRLRATDISSRTLGQETIVLNLSTSRYFTITGTGTRIFELLVEERSLDDLVATIVDEYEAEPAAVRNDVAAFVDRLRAAELLV
jgi:hypothetical protein